METSLGKEKFLESTFHLAAKKQAGTKIAVNKLLLSRIQDELTAKATFSRIQEELTAKATIYPTRIDCAEHRCFLRMFSSLACLLTFSPLGFRQCSSKSCSHGGAKKGLCGISHGGLAQDVSS